MAVVQTLASPLVVFIERKSNGYFTTLPPNGSVFPLEQIRISAHDVYGATATFRLRSATGEVLWERVGTRELFGNKAWVDATAPREIGSYIAEAESARFQFIWSYGRVVAQTAFNVSTSAPSIPKVPGGIWSNLTQLVILSGVVIGAILLLSRRK